MQNSAYENLSIALSKSQTTDNEAPRKSVTIIDNVDASEEQTTTNGESSPPERENWGKSIEFLMSCIAISVGLGNVWRFPFTALENGGGAFLLPYLIVLFVIGRPLYYLEMILGQFSSKNSINAYDISPIFRGAGIGQLVGIFLLATYYSSIMALIGRYLFDSFKSPLPWTECQPDWINCKTASGHVGNTTDNSTQLISSTEYYFLRDVLQESDDITNGIGMPILNLAGFLLIAWVFIVGVLIRGIRSSGKASYFLALFPYVIMAVLLGRAVTLPGAWNGILYFLKPRWDKILEPTVWYAAVNQCFFSLAVGLGNIVMYASFNKFDHNIYRDATIVTTIDTFTSLIAGLTIFGILGHLAHELGTDDIAKVVTGGPGIAFVSYPEAIARFDAAPQAFAILFFVMLFVLGIGSNIGMCSCIITILRDRFKWMTSWQAAVLLGIAGFSISLIYVTPGGQWMLNLVDHFGASTIAFILCLFEVIAVCWVYGVSRFCRDIEFMIKHKPGLYWRLCWGIVTPVLMIIILVYTIFTYVPLTYKGIAYPDWAITLGWSISLLGAIQIPLWGIVAVYKQKGGSFAERFRRAFKPTKDWGPQNPQKFESYQKLVATYEEQQRQRPPANLFVRIKRNIFD